MVASADVPPICSRRAHSTYRGTVRLSPLPIEQGEPEVQPGDECPEQAAHRPAPPLPIEQPGVKTGCGFRGTVTVPLPGVWHPEPTTPRLGKTQCITAMSEPRLGKTQCITAMSEPRLGKTQCIPAASEIH
eukprot:TRINITY_DN4507_c0_g1_i3.p3 TRINITY_DN4507_c0_g1~~TRINITY_DN4507_c0_g1_i3.p3  ORF type:complete len:131 (-),score=2.39 TRINITY_DN4507_c0_g1_i3:443-835(-)